MTVDIADKLRLFKSRKDTARAEQAYDYLGCIIGKLPGVGKSDILEAIHESNRGKIITGLTGDRGYTRLLDTFVERFIPIVRQKPEVFGDPIFQLNLVTLYALLMDAYPALVSETDRPIVEDEMEYRLELMVREIYSTIANQSTALCVALTAIVEYVATLKSSGLNLCLLELPVGNSIPTKLLLTMLQNAGNEATVVQVSLSRNDSRKNGVTRNELISIKLSNVIKNTLLMYLDEWISGSNFNNVCEFVTKSISSRTDVFFLPIGLLTDKSHTDKNYETYEAHHNAHISKVGYPGQSRFVIPAMRSVCGHMEYFFWSERDRLAGYRKMQFMGSLVSSIDAAIEELHTDPKALSVMKLNLLANIATTNPDDNVSIDIIADEKAFADYYAACYADYLACRDSLMSIKHDNNEAVDDETGMGQVAELIADTIGDRPCKFCVECAIVHIREGTNIDPADRYFFKEHVPVITDLTGHALKLNYYLMRELIKHLWGGDVRAQWLTT